MRLQLRYLFVLILVILASFAFFNVASAQSSGLCGGDNDPLANLFCGQSIAQMVNAAFQVAILVGSVLAMLRIGYAGWLYMGSADMWSSKSAAKEVFTDAIIGLLILLAIWMILNQINPDILKLERFQ